MTPSPARRYWECFVLTAGRSPPSKKKCRPRESVARLHDGLHKRPLVRHRNRSWRFASASPALPRWGMSIFPLQIRRFRWPRRGPRIRSEYWFSQTRHSPSCDYWSLHKSSMLPSAWDWPWRVAVTCVSRRRSRQAIHSVATVTFMPYLNRASGAARDFNGDPKAQHRPSHPKWRFAHARKPGEPSGVLRGHPTPIGLATGLGTVFLRFCASV